MSLSCFSLAHGKDLDFGRSFTRIETPDYKLKYNAGSPAQVETIWFKPKETPKYTGSLGNSKRRFSFDCEPQVKFNLRENEKALDTYREGWANGNTDLILSIVNKDTFNFTWVPDNDEVSPGRFPNFFGDFVSASEKASGKNYYMKFDNIIHRRIGDTLYEAADWIVDGFDRGSYFNAARDGLVIWDMATT